MSGVLALALARLLAPAACHWSRYVKTDSALSVLSSRSPATTIWRWRKNGPRQVTKLTKGYGAVALPPLPFGSGERATAPIG